MRTKVGEGELACSSALVAANLVVTARHCVAYFTEGGFACNVRGELLPGSTDGGRLGLDFPPDDIEFYAGEGAQRKLVARGLEIFSTLTDTVCGDDLAYVVLDRKLDLPIMPLRLEGKAKIGEKVSLTGFGLDGKMSFDTPIDDLALQVNDALEIYDIGPTAVADVITAPPRTLVVAGPAGCVGDSGGPLSDTTTGAVLGVFSLLLGDSCLSPDARGYFPYLRDYAWLTAEAFEAAGAVPLSEGSGGHAQAGASSDDEGGAGGSDGVAASGAAGHAGDHVSEGGQGGHAGSAAGGTARSPAPGAAARTSGCSLALQSGVPAHLALALALALLARRRTGHGQCRGPVVVNRPSLIARVSVAMRSWRVCPSKLRAKS
jgi:hypothetical protein